MIADDLGNITPTVELNALAMKRGETTTYHVEPPKGLSDPDSDVPPDTITDSFLNPRYYQGLDYGPLSALKPYPNKSYNYRGQMGGPAFSGRGRNYNKVDYNVSERDVVQKLVSFLYFLPLQRQNSYYNYPPAGSNDDPYKVTLEVGSRKFLGIGSTLQSARHDAASKLVQLMFV